jgi:hypothetical protein
VTRVGLALYKAVLRLYPSEFRHRYSNAMVQSLVDRHRHDRMRLSTLIVREVVDAARVASRMRWESHVNRTIILITGTTVAAAIALAVSPWLLIPIASAVFAFGSWASRQGRSVRPSTAGSARGVAWLLAGVVSVVTAIAIPAIDGGELSEPWWTVFALCLIGGIAMMVFGAVRALQRVAAR